MIKRKATLLESIYGSLDLSIFLAEAGVDEDETEDFSESLDNQLEDWVATSVNGEACRGIETILLRKDREAFAKDARRAVLEATRLSPWEIADRYRKFSQHATIFATSMADADSSEVDLESSSFSTLEER